MSPMPLSEAQWRQLLDQAGETYRQVGRMAFHFARGKLKHDPVFRAVLERGDLRPREHILDLGCGQGLIGALLHAARSVHQAGQWPTGLVAPLDCAYHGIELMPVLTHQAQAALYGGGPGSFEFTCADVTQATLPTSDLVLLLDVLHYIDLPAQRALLQRVKHALSPQGRLMMRVGDASNSQRHAFGQWVDRLVVSARGQQALPHFGRPLSSWMGMLQDLGFSVSASPMSQGTPFANVLLIAQVNAKATLSIEDLAA